MKKTISLSVGIALALFAVLFVSAASATTTVTIQDVSIAEGETITVPIMINDVVNAAIAHIVLSYNQSVVNVTDIGNSAFTESFRDINNSGGYVRYCGYNMAGLTGNLKFLDVTLEAVGSHGEQSPLNLTVVSLLNLSSDQIPRDVLNGTFTVTEAPPATTGDIIINEIMYRPAGADSDYEWIELYNNDTVPINISDWSIDGGDITDKIMDPESYVVLANNKSAFEGRYGTLPCSTIEVSFSYLTNGDTIVLENATEVEMDNITYPPDVAGENYTAELNTTGWYESKIEGGTPCDQNSVVGPLVDATPPTTEVTTPEMPEEPSPIPSGHELNWTSEDVVISFRCTDNGGGNISGVNYTNYSKTGETGWTTVNATTAIGPDEDNVIDIDITDGILTFNVTVSDEGTTKIYYYSVDRNETAHQEATKNLTVRIDTVDPVINSVDLDTYAPDAGGQILVTVDATDALSGVATVTANGAPLTEQGSPWSGTITAEFLPETYNVTVIATDDAGNTITNDTVQYTIAVEYGVELTTDKTAETIMQGETATYTLTVTNTGNVADTINLTKNGIGTLSKDSIVDLVAGASENVTLTVTSGDIGDHETIVNATSQSDVNKTASVTVTTTVEEILYGVELGVDDNTKTIKQDETATYTLTVTNTGNVADTINLTKNGIGTLSKDSIVDLAAGASEDVTLDVTTTVVGAHVTTVNAMSQGDVSQTDNVTVTTTVEKKVAHHGGGGGGAPHDSDGDGYSDIQEMIASTDKDDPCDPDPECAACLASQPAPTPTPTAAPTPTPTAKPTTPPVPTPEPTPEPTATPEDPGFEAVLAIAGLLAVAYLALRRKRK